MATFTTPRTAATGDVFTAAWYNSELKNSILDLDERLALPESVDFSTVATSETTGSTSYTDLATSGPSVTLTTGTFAFVVITAQIKNDTAGAVGFVGVDVSGATTAAADDDDSLLFESSAANDQLRSSTVVPVTLTAGSNTFKLEYKVSAGTGTFLRREISVLPIGE